MSEFRSPREITPAIGTEEAVVVAIKKPDIAHIKEHANIPKRYKDAKFVSKTDEQEKLVSKIRENLGGRNLSDTKDMLIMGTIGTGKTHIVIGAMNSLIEKGVYCRYTTEHELLEMYFRKEYTKFDGFKETMILAIDEIGDTELVDWQKKQLLELIKHRYNTMLPTIFITNMELGEFKKFVGDRVTDRLRDNKIIQVVLDGKSLRGAV